MGVVQQLFTSGGATEDDFVHTVEREATVGLVVCNSLKTILILDHLSFLIFFWSLETRRERLKSALYLRLKKRKTFF